MQNTIQHITIKLLAFLLVLAVLLPVVIKLNHVFEDHKHEVCNEHTKTHFHAIDLDCEFYKFNFNTVYSVDLQDFYFDLTENNHNIIRSQYQFVSSFQKLPFPLRGPPYTV